MSTLELIIGVVPGLIGMGAAITFAVMAIGRGDKLAAEKDRRFEERELRVEAEDMASAATADVARLRHENERLLKALTIAETAALAASKEEVRRAEEDPNRSADHLGARVDDLLSTPLPGYTAPSR